MADSPTVYLVRHGETEWTLSGQHTGGGTDIPLTEHGRQQAMALRAGLVDIEFALVLSSPLSRALDTCRLAGFGEELQTTEDLLEWDYGEYDGLTTADIRKQRPRWSVWADGAPGGETAAEVGTRCDRIVKELRAAAGDAILFGHGHCLRVLAARWLGLPAGEGRLFALEPATISTLAYERETAVIRRWNDPAAHYA